MRRDPGPVISGEPDIKTPEGRAALAATPDLPAILAAERRRGGSAATMMGALVNDPQARAALVSSQELGQALQQVEDGSTRRAMAATLMALLRPGSEIQRYCIERAIAERPLAPPRVAKELARCWGDLVRQTRPDAPAETAAFEALLADEIADALFGSDVRPSAIPIEQYDHELRLTTLTPSGELLELAVKAGLITEERRPAAERVGADMAAHFQDQARYRSMAMATADLFPDRHVVSVITWEGAQMYVGRNAVARLAPNGRAAGAAQASGAAGPAGVA